MLHLHLFGICSLLCVDTSFCLVPCKTFLEVQVLPAVNFLTFFLKFFLTYCTFFFPYCGKIHITKFAIGEI